MSEESPVAAAAAAIKIIHQENIALIDGGHIFTRDGVDVSGEIRKLSEEQIVLCDAIIEQRPVGELLSQQSQMALDEVVRDIAEVKAKRATTEELPEIGNYGHKEV